MRDIALPLTNAEDREHLSYAVCAGRRELEHVPMFPR